MHDTTAISIWPASAKRFVRRYAPAVSIRLERSSIPMSTRLRQPDHPLESATIDRIERDWNELDRWLRTTVECWREEARAQIGRLGSLKQYTGADRRASIFSLNG